MALQLISLLPRIGKAAYDIVKFHRKGSKYAPGPKLFNFREATGQVNASKKALTAFGGKVKSMENQFNTMLKSTKGKKFPDIKKLIQEMRNDYYKFLNAKDLTPGDKNQLAAIFRHAENALINFQPAVGAKVAKRLTNQAVKDIHTPFRHASEANISVRALNKREISALGKTKAEKFKNKYKKKKY